MGADETNVDTQSLQDFHGSLQSRVDEAGRALVALITSPGNSPPALGGFHDAGVTAGRHQVLHDQYVERVRRLINALVAAQIATAKIVEEYRNVEQLNTLQTDELRDLMRPVNEALHGGRTNV